MNLKTLSRTQNPIQLTGFSQPKEDGMIHCSRELGYQKALKKYVE